ncbi:MAG TPA: sugar phosphate isomerase [Candidatus Competibacter sp.]|nr:sugar phosphate isomerase [Candidatus Competibacter sp.]HRW67085.1 sugar phosphate isomerase [Candidatus Competibacter sp.]
MESKPVTVATSAYGADQVRERGQAYFVPIAARAGAAGIEIRQELLTPADPALETLRDVIAEQGLFAIYSAPLELWRADGGLAAQALQRVQAEAATLEACFLKVALGHFHDSCSISELAGLLAGNSPRLLIENDQTPQGGRIDPLVAFFLAVTTAGLPVGMTFDIGNWRWTGTDPRAAVQSLASYVEYVHCKGVVEDGGRLKAIPLTDAEPQWRELFEWFSPNVPRAIEFPLVGVDLDAVTRRYVTLLASA